MPDLAACPLLLIATGLALGFHRLRAAQTFLLLAALAGATVADEPRWLEAAQRWLPLFIVAIALLPESRWLARRNLLLWLAIAVALALGLAAPEHIHRSIAWALSAAVGFARPAPGAALLLAVAALVSLGRYVRHGQPGDIALSLVLLVAVVAAGRGAVAGPAWGITALAAILSVLYVSYRMAFVDGLTGLPNRRALDETLARLSGSYALAMVDVDHFKNFNDTHGHDAGDIVLRQVGRVLHRHARGRAFRYGGEEFCVVFEGDDDERTEASLEAARTALESLRIFIPKSGRRIPNKSRRRDRPEFVGVTMSIGHASRSAERRHPQEVLKAADGALYRAKDAGRNRVMKA